MKTKDNQSQEVAGEERKPFTRPDTNNKIVPIETLMKELELFDKQNIFSREQVKIVVEKALLLKDKQFQEAVARLKEELDLTDLRKFGKYGWLNIIDKIFGEVEK